MGNIVMRHDLACLVIENGDVLPARNGEDRVGDTQIGVLQDHDTRIISRVIQPSQGEKFGNGVILAIAACMQKLASYGPVVFHAVIIDIQHVTPVVGVLVDTLELLVSGQIANAVNKFTPLAEVTFVNFLFLATPLRDIFEQMPFKHLYPLCKNAYIPLSCLIEAKQVAGECERMNRQQ